MAILEYLMNTEVVSSKGKQLEMMGLQLESLIKECDKTINQLAERGMLGKVSNKMTSVYGAIQPGMSQQMKRIGRLGTAVQKSAVNTNEMATNVANAMSVGASVETKGANAEMKKSNIVSSLSQGMQKALEGFQKENKIIINRMMLGDEYGYLEDAHAIVEQYDLTEEQKEYIYNLENLIGKKDDDVDYTATRVAGLEVTAAALFAHGDSVEFVSCVLGNCCAEHCVGGIEITEDNERRYVKKIREYFNTEYGYEFDTLYSNKLVYEIGDDGEFLNKVDEYEKNKQPYNVIGLGTCQWTTIDRFTQLLRYYKEEMGINPDDTNATFDRDITFTEAARAETKLLIDELDSGASSSADENFYNEVGNKFDTNNYLNNEEEIKEGTAQFFADYEIGERTSVPKRDNSAWNIYVTMNGGKIE